MAKPSVTTIAVKEAPLTYAELDTNFTNLRDATLTVSDGVNSTPIDLNGTITFAGGDNVTVTENAGVITIDSEGGSGGASELYTPRSTVNISFATSSDAQTHFLQDFEGLTFIEVDSGTAAGTRTLRLDARDLPRNKLYRVLITRTAGTAGVAISIQFTQPNGFASGPSLSSTQTLQEWLFGVIPISATVGVLRYETVPTGPGNLTVGMHGVSI